MGDDEGFTAYHILSIRVENEEVADDKNALLALIQIIEKKQVGTMSKTQAQNQKTQAPNQKTQARLLKNLKKLLLIGINYLLLAYN